MIHAQKQGRLFSSQSKGGQLGSKTNLLKLEKKFDAIKNTTIGKWTVLNEPFAFKRCKKFYINCMCSCGNIKALEIGRVIRNEVSGCMSCRSL